MSIRSNSTVEISVVSCALGSIVAVMSVQLCSGKETCLVIMPLPL